ncbi:hypothetical protein Tco_1364174 [Tanacetum coccineum]
MSTPDELFETEESRDFLEYSLLYGWMDAPVSVRVTGRSQLVAIRSVPFSDLLYRSVGTRSKRMHWMDARALRRKDAFRGEWPWGDTVCDPWISDRETVSKLRG